MTSPEIVTYIKKQKDLSVPETSYKSALLSQGWKIEDINEALASISSGVPLPPQVVNLDNPTLRAKIIAVLQILFDILLAGTLFLLFFRTSEVDSSLTYFFFKSLGLDTALNTPSLWLVTNSNIGLVFIFCIFASVMAIINFSYNNKVEEQTGKKIKYLTIINWISIIIILLFISPFLLTTNTSMPMSDEQPMDMPVPCVVGTWNAVSHNCDSTETNSISPTADQNSFAAPQSNIQVNNLVSPNLNQNSLVISQPVLQATWEGGHQYTISWHSAGQDPVTIQACTTSMGLTHAKKCVTLAENQPASGTYLYAVPTDTRHTLGGVNLTISNPKESSAVYITIDNSELYFLLGLDK